MIYSGAHSTQSVPCSSQRPQRRTEKELGQDVAFTSTFRAARREKGCNSSALSIKVSTERKRRERLSFVSSRTV